MSRPVKEKSLEGATQTGGGKPLQTGGRITLSLFVVTDADPTALEVQLEGSMDGENWGTLKQSGGERGQITAADLTDPDGDGNFAAFAGVHGIAADYVRARITSYDAAGNVDAWVGATDNPNSTKAYREVGSS